MRLSLAKLFLKILKYSVGLLFLKTKLAQITKGKRNEKWLHDLLRISCKTVIGYCTCANPSNVIKSRSVLVISLNIKSSLD
jgi:hypothetical protein